MRTTSCCTLTVSHSHLYCQVETLTSSIALVTGQLAHDLGFIGQEIEKLYGVLSEEDLKLQ
jgi:hypothetical protein